MSRLVLSAVDDAPVIEGQITLNNCTDVHIGPRYKNDGDVVIQQNISVIGESGSLYSLSSRCRQFVITESVNSHNHQKLTGDIVEWLIHNRCTLSTAVILVALFTSAIILFLIIKYKENVENFRETSINTAEQEREYPQSLKFVWRDAWGAAQPTSSERNNSVPVERIIICHSASQGTCNKFSACKQKVLSFQELHMDTDHDYGDIGYNFVIGGDGYIYVGRGWNKVGAHSIGYNYNSLGIAFIGDFRVDELNDNMMKAAETLVGLGVKMGKLSPDYQVYGHCQVAKGLPVSPGKNLMKFIRTWSHWNNTNLSQCKG